MKAQGKQVTRECLDESTLSELRDDLLNNWEILYSNTKYQPYKKYSGVPVDRASNRQIYKKHFNQVPLLKNLVDTFETMLLYLSVNMVWMLRKSKEGVQGWHKDLYLGGQIAKTIVINVGSKVINNEETLTFLENDDFFEVDQWREIEEYDLSGFNLEDKHCQDDERQALIPTNHPSVSPSAILHKNPLLQPVVIPHKTKATIFAVVGRNDDDIADDNRKPAAKSQEEMFTTAVQEQMVTNTILHSLVIGNKVGPWICEFCD
jgi:hypothetical protein